MNHHRARRCALLLLTTIPLAAACSSTAPQTPTDPPATTTDTTSAPAGANPATTCLDRNRTDGDVLVRTTMPGLPAATQLLGAWAWNAGALECQSAADYQTTITPPGSGICVQIATAADNPGYDTSASPAPPLKKVAAAVGDC